MVKHTLTRASIGLRILAQVERAHLLGDEHEVERLLAGVDPVDLMQTANELRVLAASLPPQTDGSAGASAGTPAPAHLRAVPCS